MELKLPLGLIFLENDGGCFVTKVSPDGSAARSGGIEVGDQLAVVNGTIGSRMTVDDICKVIKVSPNPKQVELVLVLAQEMAESKVRGKTALKKVSVIRVSSMSSRKILHILAVWKLVVMISMKHVSRLSGRTTKSKAYSST